ncbi:hypothetical protein AHAS_Ahas02G0118800 [Arachis hypogaea]
MWSHASGKTVWGIQLNGYKFRTTTKEDGLKIQNSEVYVSSNTRSYASMRDNRVAVGSVPYYGKLVDIIKLNYCCHFTVESKKTILALPALISLVQFTSVIEMKMNRTYWHQKLSSCTVYVMK